MRILVCDDDEIVCQRMQQIVSSAFPNQEHSIHVYTSAKELPAKIQENGCDLLFLDIHLEEEKNGIDISSELYEEAPEIFVVYLSGYAKEYFSSIFDRPANLAGFLQKPIKEDEVIERIQKVEERLRIRNEKYLLIDSKKTVAKIPYEDILYVESQEHYLHIHTAKDNYQIFGKLSDLMEMIPGYFFQCHKSYLVNFQRIHRIDGKVILLDQGDSLVMSRRFMKSTTDAYRKYLIGRYSL